MENDSSIEEYYAGTFIPAAHKVGRVTLGIAIVASLFPALYLSFVLGGFPGTGIIVGAFLAVAAFVGIAWVVEPLSYFPMLGVSGSYMSFLSGNIGNMRLPVVISCQNAIGAEIGSTKAEIAAVLGIAVSVIINLIFVVALVLLGNLILAAMPPVLKTMLENYTFASLYAAVFIMFFTNAKLRMHGFVAIGVGIVVLMAPISEIMNVTSAGIAGIVVSLLLARFPANKTAL